MTTQLQFIIIIIIIIIIILQPDSMQLLANSHLWTPRGHMMNIETSDINSGELSRDYWLNFNPM